MPKKRNAADDSRSRRAKAHRIRRSELGQRLARDLPAQHGVSAGQRIGVAVSGGADSVALLRLLLEVREQLGIVLSVAHFNHQLRGKASDADEKFVAGLAAQYGLPFLADRGDVAARARQQAANLEEAARCARYAFFDRLAAEGQIDRVAVAHTADDQAETVLAHILRGTGIAGLGGIHPQAGEVFRPLLKFRRSELRTYLRGLKQTWREDATNRDITRTRARIRRKLLPFLEKQFQSAVVEHLCQLADLARADDAWMEGAADLRVCAVAKQEKDGWRVPARELIGERQHEVRNQESSEHPQNQRPASEAGLYNSVAEKGHAETAIGKRMIRLLVKRVKPRAGQLSAVHVDAVLGLAQGVDGGKALRLPGGVEVRRERDSLVFRPVSTQTDTDYKPTTFEYPVNLSTGRAELKLVEHSCALRFEVIDWGTQGRETSRLRAVLDRDKLREALVVRNWRPGDAMQPVGHQKSHALSRLLNELGVSRWEKTGWPVLACGEKIAWCRGLPVAVEFSAGGSTRAGLLISEALLV